MGKSQLKWFLTTFQLFDPKAKEESSSLQPPCSPVLSQQSRQLTGRGQERKKYYIQQNLSCPAATLFARTKNQTPSDGMPCLYINTTQSAQTTPRKYILLNSSLILFLVSRKKKTFVLLPVLMMVVGSPPCRLALLIEGPLMSVQ